VPFAPCRVTEHSLGRRISAPKPKARFSLAGVQMKLSVIKNTGKGGGLTLPLGDEQGSYSPSFLPPHFPACRKTNMPILLWQKRLAWRCRNANLLSNRSSKEF